MKARQVLLVVVAALICGGVAGYASAQLADDDGKERTIVAVEELQFVDGSGNLQVTLEPGGVHRPGLVLKDPTGRLLYDLPPSLKLLPIER